MIPKFKAMVIFSIIAIALVLVGCSTTTTTPTADLKSMALTVAWQTIQATIPKTTVMPPTTAPPLATPPSIPTVPPFPTLAQLTQSNIPAAGLTLTPRTTQSITPTVRVMATFVGTGTSITTTPVKISTTGPSTAPPDRGTISWENPLDYAQFLPRTAFVKTWRLKNIGSTTWKKEYLIRFWAGSGGRMGGTDRTLDVEVKPGQETEVSMNFVCPDSGGDYISSWVLGTDQAANFFQFFVAITVTDSPAVGGATSTRGAIMPTAVPK